MPEIRTIVQKTTMSYTGVFSIKELRDIVMQWILDKGYVPIEKKAAQVVKKTAKFFEFKLKPFKKLSDYAQSVLKIAISASDCRDVIIKAAGKKKKMQEGKVIVSIEGLLQTDYEAKWEKTSFLYALRVIFEKYVIAPFISAHAKQVTDDTNQLISQIRAYLNLQKRM